SRRSTKRQYATWLRSSQPSASSGQSDRASSSWPGGNHGTATVRATPPILPSPQGRQHVRRDLVDDGLRLVPRRIIGSWMVEHQVGETHRAIPPGEVDEAGEAREGAL